MKNLGITHGPVTQEDNFPGLLNLPENYVAVITGEITRLKEVVQILNSRTQGNLKTFWPEFFVLDQKSAFMDLNARGKGWDKWLEVEYFNNFYTGSRSFSYNLTDPDNLIYGFSELWGFFEGSDEWESVYEKLC